MSWGVIDNNASKPAYLSADSNAYKKIKKITAGWM